MGTCLRHIHTSIENCCMNEKKYFQNLPNNGDLLGSNGNKYWFCLTPKAKSKLQAGVAVNKIGFHQSCKFFSYPSSQHFSLFRSVIKPFSSTVGASIIFPYITFYLCKGQYLQYHLKSDRALRKLNVSCTNHLTYNQDGTK